MKTPMGSEAVLERMLDRVIPEPNTGCLLWLGAADRKRHHEYGFFKWPGRGQSSAHRWMWTAAKGEIPAGALVLHKCDTPRCVNPEHLFLGTSGDNTRDRDQKKRHCHGTKQKKAKLDEQKVLEIRASTERLRVLAARYGVSIHVVSQTRRRKLWKHVEDRAEV